uniref:Uncharacterized protein LOC111123277 n=1 Tax=Crassostrea virginica TaxID=6565 RepID=A0A8B8CZB3_CRAVI|nr:uncharacterized protein LOC111123277 [Crassostrea virginica]
MSGGKMAILDQRKIDMLQPYIKAKGITPVLQTELRQEIMRSYQKIRDIADYAARYCRIYKKFKLRKPTKELYTPNQELPLDFDEQHRANATTPPGFSIETSSIPGAGLGAWALKRVRMFTVLGEYEGEEHKSDRDMTYSWIIYEDEEEEQRHYIDASSPSKSNWLRYINCARHAREENVHSFPCDGLVFYMTTRDVEPDTELLTWYGRGDGLSMGITRIHPESRRCKEGFVNVEKWCFSFHLDGASFSKSREFCNEIGGEMVVLDSKEKEEVLTDYIEDQGFTYKALIQRREDLLRSHHRLKITDIHGDRYCDFFKKYKDSKPTKDLYLPNAQIPVESDEENRANLTTPPGISVKLSSLPGAGLGAWATESFPVNSVLGLYEGEEFLDDGEFLYGWIINSDDESLSHFVDAESPARSNWLRYVNCARNEQEENIHPVFCEDLVFYMTSKDVAPNTELLTWYGNWYGKKLGINRVHPEDDLDFDDVFYIRVSSLRQTNPGKYCFHDNTTVTYTNWIPKRYYKTREREYWGDVFEPFGLLLSYYDGQWRWVPEKDYSYFTNNSVPMEAFGGSWRDSAEKHENPSDLGGELLEAIWCNNPSEVTKLIEEGADVNKIGIVSEDEPISPLSLACKMGHVDIVNILIQRKVDLNMSGHDGKTALHYTCEGDERRDEKKEDLMEILRLLIKNGANMEAMNNMGCTPLFSACEVDDVDMVKILVQSCCRVNVQSVNGDSPMKVACRNAKFWTYWHSREMSMNSAQSNPNYFPPVQITKILLHASADITEATLLPTAVQFGDLTLVKELIELGMDINMLDDNMCTPLGSACSCVNVKTEVVKLLLDHGADVNRGGGWKKQKPIIFAYVHNSVNKIKLLLSFGATLTRDEMTNLVSLSFSKSVLENPEVITPWSKELMSWNLLLGAGFTPQDNDPVLANKIDQLRLCSSFDKINPWIWDMIFPMRSLKGMCRIAIRNSLNNVVKDVAVELLPLPTEIKRYLQFSEFSLPEKTSTDSYGSRSPVKSTNM